MGALSRSPGVRGQTDQGDVSGYQRDRRAVPGEPRVGGKESQAVHYGLRDQQPVEWVTVVIGEGRRHGFGCRPHRNFREFHVHGTGVQLGRRQIEIGAAESKLDGNFLDARGAEKDIRVGIRQCRAYRLWQPVAARPGPNQNIRVQQDAHSGTFEQIQQIVRKWIVEIIR